MKKRIAGLVVCMAVFALGLSGCDAMLGESDEGDGYFTRVGEDYREENGGSNTNNWPPSATTLSYNSWRNGNLYSTGEVAWYSFSASSSSRTYYVQWNDRGNGDATKTCDIKVTAYNSSGSVISSLNGVDSGYYPARTIYGVSGTVYLKVEGYNNTSTGSYGIMYYY